MTKSRFPILLSVLILVLSITSACADKCAPPPKYVDLTILHTNDLHGHLFPFATRALAMLESDVGGAARRATLIRRIRAEAKHPVLLMDAGDAFTRGPIADLEGKPDFDVMNAMAYDVVTIGNTEFKGAPGDRGRQVLFERIKQARFPVLSANVFDKVTNKPIACPYTVLEVSGVRVGVLGLTAPRVASYEQFRDLIVKDPIEVAAEVVPELRKRCDFVVALTHIGFALDLELAHRVPGIDVVIGGDSHTWFFQPILVKSSAVARDGWSVGGTLVCQAGEWGKCLGRLDLRLRRSGDSYEVTSYKGELIEVDSTILPASDIESILSAYCRPFTRVVGTLAAPVDYANAASWVAEAMRDATGAQVGAQPIASVEDGLRAGKVTLLDIRRMFPWPNPAARLTLTGKQLAQYVCEAELGLAGARFVDGQLQVGDAELSDDAAYTLAIEDYFAIESPLLSSAPRVVTDRSIRQILADRIRQ